MNRLLATTLFGALLLIGESSASSAAEPAASTPSKPAVERKDGFFGIHFDLHPNKSDTVLGRDVSQENIRAFLRRVRPDFIQYDCVAVPGYSGYPTKVGWPAPGIVKDSLAVWRKVTREERVALLSVNGREVTVGKDCVPRTGYLCLESEGSECHFRNLRIRELPSTQPHSEEIAGLALSVSPALSPKLPRAEAVATPHLTDWLRDARLGVFMHFLPGDAKGLAKVDELDVPALTRQLQEMGAGYFVLTLGQNSGFFNAPNAVYDQFLGCAAGERCSRRDLPLDLHRALQPAGIRLMLYLPCQTPNGDARAQRAFGLPEGKKDQPISEEFARKWAKVIHAWSARYGDKVAGWWFDGGYQHIHFNEAIAGIYADAVKRGNPRALVTFNPGVKLVRHTRAEDYTAGELNEPFNVLPTSRLVDGSQWHALTYLGSTWGRRETRHPNERWIQWVSAVVAKGGAVTLDLGPNWNPASGPIGTFSEAQVAQVKAIYQALSATK